MVQPTALQRQVGPAETGHGLGTQRQVDAAAPRVGIDQQGVGRAVRQCGREQRRAGPATTRDHRGHRPAAAVLTRGFHGVGQFGDKVAVLRRQRHDVLGANRYRGFPFGGLGLGAADQDDPSAAGQRTLGAAPGALRIEQYRPPRRSTPCGWTVRRHGRPAHRRPPRCGPRRRAASVLTSASTPLDTVITPPCGRGGDMAPSPRRRTVDEAASVDNLGRRKRRSATTGGHAAPIRIAERATEKRDDPRQGGGAEVVVYQPRGVGLMHTRHKPSNAHYTHGMAEGCKCCLPDQAADSNAESQAPGRVVACHFAHAAGWWHPSGPMLGAVTASDPAAEAVRSHR